MSNVVRLPAGPNQPVPTGGATPEEIGAIAAALARGARAHAAGPGCASPDTRRRSQAIELEAIEEAQEVAAEVRNRTGLAEGRSLAPC